MQAFKPAACEPRLPEPDDIFCRTLLYGWLPSRRQRDIGEERHFLWLTNWSAGIPTIVTTRPPDFSCRRLHTQDRNRLSRPGAIPPNSAASGASDREHLRSGDDVEDAQAWDLVVRPHASLLSLGLAEVWENRDLLVLFARRDIVAFYKQTILGPLWFLIQPLCTTAIYVLVFANIAGLSTDGAPEIAFYLCGITFWNYFADCFNKTATVFKDNASLFSKVYFPRVILPLSIVGSNLIRFVIQFVLFLGFMGWYWVGGEIRPNAYAGLLPVLVLLMATIGLSMGMLFSALTTKYRDLVFLLQFGVQLLMYATPVIYPTSQMPARVAEVLSWNPLAPIFEFARFGFLGSGSAEFSGLAYTACFAFVSLFVATVIFNRVERTVMDTV